MASKFVYLSGERYRSPIGRLSPNCDDLWRYLTNNVDALINYGALYRSKLRSRHRGRQANAALYRVVIIRMRGHQPELEYGRRRTSEGKSKSKIIGCSQRRALTAINFFSAKGVSVRFIVAIPSVFGVSASFWSCACQRAAVRQDAPVAHRTCPVDR